ncbi:lytic transglycosylase domain-containing protein [Deferribacteraceae bacterium V6Fe1]|nr:lytic transglycosylase domain-containing protein [Deferribacteraceae bacterium V6Fe1]
MKKTLKMYVNVLLILSISISLFSMMFNFYLVKKVNSYVTYSENLSKKYSKLQTELDNTLKLLNFYLDVQKISELIEQFDTQYNKYTITDIAYSIVEESVKNNLDPYLMLAIIKTESSFNYKSVSRKGAIGLMQLLPDTAYYISEKVDDLSVENKKEIFDPVINIRLGINYYNYLLTKFNGNEEMAIAAYNLGPRNIYKYLARGRKIPKFYYYKVMQSYAELTAQTKS